MLIGYFGLLASAISDDATRCDAGFVDAPSVHLYSGCHVSLGPDGGPAKVRTFAQARLFRARAGTAPTMGNVELNGSTLG